MKLNVKIAAVKTVNQLDFYWQEEDYLNLLKEFDFEETDQIQPEEILDYLYMTITDFEPEEAAAIVLQYKLGDKLNAGQIQNLSNEMIIDKVAEEYADPSLHFDLFNINQLLYKAYNGTFPNTEATVLTVNYENTITSKINKELLIKTIWAGLQPNNLITRLYEDQLLGTEPFGDAEKIIWHYKKIDERSIEVVTSKYWIEKNDFDVFEFEAQINFYQEG